MGRGCHTPGAKEAPNLALQSWLLSEPAVVVQGDASS